jgi:E3 ubiquitin-protein ligase SHPRH
LPQALIDFVPLAGENEDIQPPRKKQRISLDTQDVIPILIQRTTFDLQFSSSKLSPLERRVPSRSAPPLHIAIDQENRNKPKISISYESRQPGNGLQHHNTVAIFATAFQTTDESSLKHITIALNGPLYRNESPAVSNKAKEGYLWVDMGLEIVQKDGFDCLHTTFELKWNPTTSFWLVGYYPKRHFHETVVDTYFPGGPRIEFDPASRSAQTFYESVFVPSQDDDVAASITTNLATEPFPFQKRTLKWLLKREGVQWSNGRIEPIQQEEKCLIRSSFRQASDANAQPVFISDLLNVVTRNIEPLVEMDRDCKGGILAEEMGLGKTVEIAALLSLHRAKTPLPATVYDPYANAEVRPTAATLIIAPVSILQQWISELNTHAPDLKVFHYKGMRSIGNMNNEERIQSLKDYDVVVTTYSVLAAEIHFATPPPDRKSRRERKYERPESPLPKLLWWRVCLDEAQMIESGVSNAALVARMIPRVNAWGVSGTPVRRDIKDLHGLLIFLRREPFGSFPKVFDCLVKSPADFKQLFGTLALRHTKEQVMDELHLPPQKRFVITMPFTPIEEQHYQSLFQEMAEDCGLDEDGAPVEEDWNPNRPKTIEKMRNWLLRLRQTAVHPEIGGRNRRALGRDNGPLRTVDEVLGAMLEQSDTAIRADERVRLISKMKRGQLLENSPRVKESLAIWTEALNEATVIVEEFRTQLRDVQEQDQKPQVETIDSSDESSNEDGPASDSKIGILRNRLRAALEVQHMAIFFRANAIFQIKTNEEWTKPDTEEFKEWEKLEMEAYETAKKVRQEILQEIFTKASRLMKKIEKKAKLQDFVQVPEFFSKKRRGGIESTRLIERLDELGDALDAQANELDEWREATIQFLLKPLVDEEEDKEITGDEYEDSTKTQDEVMVYVQALRAVVADRYDAITGQENALVKSEVRTSLKLAEEGGGAFPEKTISLLTIRGQIKPPPELGSFRAIVADLRALATDLRVDAEGGSKRAEAELAIVEQERQRVQKQMTEQSKACTVLEQEIDLFTSVMNTRLEYYRQLQQVSDMVAIYEGDGRPNEYDRLREKEIDLERRIATAKAKRRYLLHLQSEATSPQEQRLCIICQSSFEIGALTVCGHQYCRDCMRAWWKEHRTCPICKRRLSREDLHQITYKPQELQLAPSSPVIRRDSSGSRCKSAIYDNISAATLSQIQDVHLEGPSYTTKINTLARHLLYLRTSDPGCKSIIFSQYREFLGILSQALTSHRINHASISSPQGIEKFKNDPSVECFLLHAKAQSSGLNLVEASHVFLCEPLVHTAVELQAIARVDRIGQRSGTTVWLYVVQGTVEESILEISTRRRMEYQHGRHALPHDKRRRHSTEEARLAVSNSFEMQKASAASLLDKGPRGGEVVDASDLWACLFGNRKDRPKGVGLDDEDVEIARFRRAEAAEARSGARSP